MEDLGIIKWEEAATAARAPIHLYNLPSKASAIIVKYRPTISVSCVIPPQEVEASYRLGRSSRRNGVERVVTPILLMTQGIAEMPSQVRKRGVIDGYSLWALRLKDGELSKTKSMSTSPYLFGNVWERGAICFGSLSPQSLRQAFNYYWASGFNDELFRERGSHTCNNKDHRYSSSHTGCRCLRKFDHKCSCVRKTTHLHTGCGCTSVVASKRCKGNCLDSLINDVSGLKDLYEIVKLTLSMQGFPNQWVRLEDTESTTSDTIWEHWLTSVGERRLINRTIRTGRLIPRVFNAGSCKCCMSIVSAVGAAKREAANKGRPLGPRQSARHAVVTDSSYPGCECSWRHKNTCPCKHRRCQCPCTCKCCLKECKHETCSCSCCLGSCICNCNCSADVRFKEHLKIYHDKVLPNQKWKDRTTLFCGDAFWASPKSSSAILVTNHPYLLTSIPDKYQRKMSSGSGIIALGKENGDFWEFNSGTYTFRVPSRLVTTN